MNVTLWACIQKYMHEQKMCFVWCYLFLKTNSKKWLKVTYKLHRFVLAILVSFVENLGSDDQTWLFSTADWDSMRAVYFLRIFFFYYLESHHSCTSWTENIISYSCDTRTNIFQALQQRKWANPWLTTLGFSTSSTPAQPSKSSKRTSQGCILKCFCIKQRRPSFLWDRNTILHSRKTSVLVLGLTSSFIEIIVLSPTSL